MTVNVSKPAFNIREKLSELDRPVGTHGNEILKSETPQNTFDLVGTGRKNMVINGGMTISQRYGTTASTPANNKYTLDQWRYDLQESGKFTVQQVTDAPEGFSHSMKVTSTSSHTVTANNYFLAQQCIEGLNSARLKWGTSQAQPVTLSFYVKSSLTGLHACGIRNNVYDRGITQTYKINTANTWEYKSITFDGDTSGTWLTNTSSGLKINFDIGSGSVFEAASTGTWLATNDFITNQTVKIVGTNAATWYITGVQLETGRLATPFEHRSITEEQSLCQRYFNVWPPRSGGIPAWPVYTGGSQAVACVWIPHTMRTVPTPTDKGTGTSTTTGHAYNNNGTSVSTRYANGTSPTLSCGGDSTNGHFGLNMHFGSYGGSGGHEADIASWNGTSPGIWLSSEL